MTLICDERHVVEVEPFPVMGVTGRLVVVAPTPRSLALARARLQQLESRWSRFRPDSDVSRLNVADGRWTAVSPDTVALLRYMIAAHRATNGSYNPTLLPSTVNLGDARSRVDDAVSTVGASARRYVVLDAIEIDDSINGVRLPADMTIDAGGIGKGLAADLVAEQIVAEGAGGVCVNLGGDLRCAGLPPSEHGWRVDVLSPSDDRSTVSTVWLTDGAVATSTTSARRWSVAGTPRHHLLDPATGAPTPTGPGDVMLASVIAARAVWAEAFTKALLVRGWESGRDLVEAQSLAALTVTGDDSVQRSATWSKFEP